MMLFKIRLGWGFTCLLFTHCIVCQIEGGSTTADMPYVRIHRRRTNSRSFTP